MFLAGLALSGSHFAHPVFAELLPLRDAFVAVFFTSVGLLFDPASVFSEPTLLAAMLGGVALKGLLCAAIVGLLWRSRRLAILSGLGLAQVGNSRSSSAAMASPAASSTRESSKRRWGRPS